MQKPGLFGMNGFLLFLLTCCSFAPRAQQPGSLILIDAENKQAFTVRVGDQLYASSGHGHLVLSHFKDSSYRLYLKVAKKTSSELVFPVTVRQRDLGLQLRGSDSSWVLYNWQTKQTILPVNEPDSNRILEMGVKREDGFSRLMAAVVNDTAVMYNTYTGNWFSKDSASTANNSLGSGVQPPNNGNADSSLAKGSQIPPTVNRQPASVKPPTAVFSAPRDQNLQPSKKTVDSTLVQSSTVSSKPNPGMPAVTGPGVTKVQIPKQKMPDSTVTKNNIPGIGNSRPPAAGVPTLSAAPAIKKLREVNLKISRKMVFLDIDRSGIRDTITLFVYFENGDTAGKKDLTAASPKKKPLTDSATANGNKQAKNNAAAVFVAGCGEMATDQDLDWLRSAILKANTEQDKIAAASNAFALKCFSVNQVRLLASLFVSDKARYRLMDAARQHISDKDHFRELADMYTDKNFQKKFLAMADKRS